VDELHALWDYILYTGYPHEVRPFADEEYDEFQITVANFTERNKDVVSDPTVYQNLDYPSWAQESYEIGITLYDGK